MKVSVIIGLLLSWSFCYVVCEKNPLSSLIQSYRHEDMVEVREKLNNFKQSIKDKVGSVLGGSQGAKKISTSLVRIQPQLSLNSRQPYVQQKHRTQRLVASNSLKSKTLSTSMTRLVSFFKGGSVNKKRLLVLISDTGGGHRASAQALDQAIQEQYPGKVDVQIMDIWTTHAAWPYNNFVPMYRYFAKRPILWRCLYTYATFPVTRRLQEIASWMTCYQKFQRAIEAADPDFVVSVHPLTQLMPLSIIRDMNTKRIHEGRPRIPFVTIVTDLGGAHDTWFDQRVDACYVPSEAVRDVALRNGLPAEKVIMRGLPIRPSFWKVAKAKENVRKSLGLPANGKTALLMGGGDGVGGLGLIATELHKKLLNLPFATQLIVICGHNKEVSNKLQKQLSEDPAHKHQVLVKGFVNNIDEYMTASDCLITKAGPGTIAESMIRGLPMVLSSYLPGQEWGNVPYVTEQGFGVYTGNRPKKIAQTVSELFENESMLADMSIRAKTNAHPEATMNIAKDIGDCLVAPFVGSHRMH